MSEFGKDKMRAAIQEAIRRMQTGDYDPTSEIMRSLADASGGDHHYIYVPTLDVFSGGEESIIMQHPIHERFGTVQQMIGCPAYVAVRGDDIWWGRCEPGVYQVDLLNEEEGTYLIMKVDDESTLTESEG